MPDYKFTGAYPMIYPLEIGADAEVTPAEGNPSVGPTGSTVYLYPLDVLHTKVPIEHAWLEEIASSAPAPAKTAPASPVPPVETTTPPVVATDPPVVPAPAGDDTKEESK